VSLHGTDPSLSSDTLAAHGESGLYLLTTTQKAWDNLNAQIGIHTRDSSLYSAKVRAHFVTFRNALDFTVMDC